MLDPRWHTFLTLCETMNYTWAAEKLCLTQPAVTHHIQYLESRYHCKLFRYEGKVLSLTEAGRTVPLAELAGERLLLREAGSGTHAIFEEALHRHNHTLRGFSTVTISDFSLLKALAADGLGVSFLYAPAAARELAAGTLARFDLADVPLHGAFYFVCLKDNLFARTWRDWLP